MTQEQLAEREKRKKESKVNEFSEGLDLSKLTLNKKRDTKFIERKTINLNMKNT